LRKHGVLRILRKTGFGGSGKDEVLRILAKDRDLKGVERTGFGMFRKDGVLKGFGNQILASKNEKATALQTCRPFRTIEISKNPGVDFQKGA
jgi:hypothetical protein